MPAFALSLVVAVALPAQSFLVDAANGPGTAFTSLVAAVAAVPDGAVLLVRSGSYAPFLIDDKSLSILADAGVTVVDVQGLVTVRNLASQRRVTLRGLNIQGLAAPARLRCQGNAGLVSIEQCRPQGSLGLVLEATQCDQLRVVDCQFNAVGAAVTLTNSQVSFVNTDFPVTSIFDAGLRQSGGITELVDCDVFGVGIPTAVPVQFLAPGTVRLLGSTRLLNSQPGSGSFGATGPGVVIRDPGAQILAGAPTTVGPGTQLVVRPMPALTTASAPLGGIQTTTLVGPAGGIGGMFAGLPSPAIGLAPFLESWFVDPMSAVPMVGGVLTGALGASYSVPASPAWLGFAIAWQGWSFDPVGGWQLSNAAVVTHW